MRFLLTGLRLFIILLIAVAMTACMVGPDFKKPIPPSTNRYTLSALPSKTVSTPAAGASGKAQHYRMGEDIPADWWRLFHSPELDQLIRMGLKNSPTLASAKATLRQAEQNLYAEFGTLLLPSVGLNLGGERQRFSDQQFGIDQSNIFNVYNTTVSVAYTFDLFGGYRRQLDALAAQVDFEQYELIAATMTLTSNIVTTAVLMASQQAQILATREWIQAVSDQLTIIRQQFELGGVSKENVLSQETLLAQTKATLPPLEKNLAQTSHALAVLVGGLPSETPLPTITLDSLTLPTDLPVSVPSDLVQQRPDIQASEALLRAANAQIGVATANFFPVLSIDGTYGWLALTLHHFFKPANNVWSFGAQIAQPLFRGGALFAQRAATMAAYDAAFFQYKETVLLAFKNVADVLRAIEADAKTFKAQMDAERAAKNTLDLTQKQFHLGAINYLNLLNAEEQYQETRIARIQAEAARFSDTAALFQALGGGWWNKKKGEFPA